MEMHTHQARCLNCGAVFPGLYNKYEMIVCEEEQDLLDMGFEITEEEDVQDE